MYNLHEGNSPIEQSNIPIEQSKIEFLYIMSLKLINKHVYLTALRVVVKYISQYFRKIVLVTRALVLCNKSHFACRN